MHVSSVTEHNTRQSGLVNRFLLFGASNLIMSLRNVIDLMRHRCGGPNEVLVAAGHGRSYGQASQVMFRRLPGITSCGLWAQLDAFTVAPTYAFLSDIGNDIPYGHEPNEILHWVHECIRRLQRHDAQIVVTNLQLARIETLAEMDFRILRTIFFPYSRLSRVEVIARARVVHRGLQELAASDRFDLFEPEPNWFGPDVIHLRFAKRAEAYRRIVEGFPGSSNSQNLRSAIGVQAAVWKKRPRFACKRVLGKERYCRQPSGELSDGSIVSLY